MQYTDMVLVGCSGDARAVSVTFYCLEPTMPEMKTISAGEVLEVQNNPIEIGKYVMTPTKAQGLVDALQKALDMLKSTSDVRE